MIKFNKKLVMALVVALTTTSLAGCNFGKKEEQIVYELTPITAEQLEVGKIYVKDADKFYECPQGTKTFALEEFAPNAADPSHTIMFGDDDVVVPTLYKDQELIYVTKETPKSFIWERYEDAGYTIGAVGLNATTTNKYSLKVDPMYLLEGSSLRTEMSNAGLEVGQEIIFNKISSTAITSANISKAGSILGLTEDEAYSVDLYRGSEFISLTNILADTHVFSCFELFESKEYDYAEADYITIKIPENLMSGYYYLYGLGFVRYVNGAVADGQSDIDFNVPYYYYDSEGNEFTYNDINHNENGETVENTETNNVDETTAEFTNTTFVDCSNEEMTVNISYKAATTKINGKETEINDAEVGIPKATLIGPDGNTYDFETSAQNENVLTCTIESPLIGEWKTNISNMSTRKFDVKTAFVSGHSDSLIHTGSGTQAMTYYVTKNMNNGLFSITWENETHAATVKITGPDKKEYTKEKINTFIYDEGYGYLKVQLGNIKSGEYKIEVDGEDLGRVICSAKDLNEETEKSKANEKEKEVEVEEETTEATE